MKPLYIIGWIIKKGESVGSWREGDDCFMTDGPEGPEHFDAMSLKRAKELKKEIKGTKIYKLVEVKRSSK